jgi:hypothetical protein
MSHFMHKMDTHSGSYLHHSHASQGADESSVLSQGTSSSKAVLAALRSLQDKIRRLETDRTRAMEEAATLRHRLQGFEVEAEQTRAKDDAIAQRNIQEARATYDRLIAEKVDLEVRVARAEERRNDIRSSSETLETDIRKLKEEKESLLLKIKDGESQQKHLDIQLQNIYSREKDLSQTLAYESRRHEEAMLSLNKRLTLLQDDLIRNTKEKSAQDSKMAELDHLIAQLLVVNETLVSKLTGKTTPSTGAGKSSKNGNGNKAVKRSQSASASASVSEGNVAIQTARNARAQSAAIAAAAKALYSVGIEPKSASKKVVKKVASGSSSTIKKKHLTTFDSPHIEYVAEQFRTAKDIRSIQGVNKLYHDLVHQLVSPNNTSPTGKKKMTSSTGKTKTTPTRPSSTQTSGSGLVASSAASREALNAARVAVYDSNHHHHQESGVNFGSPGGPTDDDFLNFSTNNGGDEEVVIAKNSEDEDRHVSHAVIHIPTVGSPQGQGDTTVETVFRTQQQLHFSPNAVSSSPADSNYMNKVAELESRFQDLDAQYHNILSDNESNNPVDAADRLVDVIRQLHETGQELRGLRTSPQKSSQ